MKLKAKKTMGLGKREVFLNMYKTMSLQEIADEKGISTERVRQILNRDVILENREFEKKLRTYEQMLKDSDKRVLFREIKRLSKYNRTKKNVEERRILLRHLKNECGLKLLEMAWYIRRDHTTVMNMLSNTK